MTRQIFLIDNTGAEINLSWPIIVGDSPALWGAPPVLFEEEQISGGTGARVRLVRHDVRDCVLPLTIVADSTLELDRTLDSLMRAIDPTRGHVRLRVQREDGSTRELVTRAVGGFENLSMRKASSTSLSIPLRLHASQPYWRAATESEIHAPIDTFQSQAPTRWNEPEPYSAQRPYNGSRATARLRVFPVRLGGDAVSWPRFQITGPASSVEALNERTGQRWRFDGTLEANQQLVVDTEPGRRLITVNGNPAFTQMGDGWQWMSLLPGLNPVSLEIEDYSDQTDLNVTYRDQWLTA